MEDSPDYKPLATHRFRLNESSSVLLGKLQEGLKDCQEDYPEIVGLTVFGSQVKGVSRSPENGKGASDIDFYLIVRDSDPSEDSGLYEPTYHRSEDVYESFVDQMHKKLGMGREGFHGLLLLVSKERIDFEIDKLMQNEGAFSRLGYLFHMQIGNGLDPFRSYILKRLKDEGNVGDKIWRDQIIKIANEMESGKLPTDVARKRDTNRKHMYPQSVNEAIDFYKLEGVFDRI